MSPRFTPSAMTNLQNGVAKMEKSLTPAAQVRRSFQLGRPKTAITDEPLHPAVVWRRANSALANFRLRMTDAGLDPADSTAFVIYVGLPDLDEPQFLVLEGRAGNNVSSEDHQRKAFEILSESNTIALGLIFQQNDWDAIQANGSKGQIAAFPYQLMGLSPRGIAVLKAAAARLNAAKVFISRPQN